MSPNGLAAAVSGMTLANKPVATDFPKFMQLPAEMRDLIFSFLLQGSKVTGPVWRERNGIDMPESSEWSNRATSNAHTYQWETNILLANHDISGAALKVLRLLNTFIKFTWTYRDPQFCFDPHAYHVPIVTENQVDFSVFPHYCIALHLRHRDCSEDEPENAITRSMLILRQDLGSLCRAIRLCCSITHGAGLLMLKDKDDQILRGYTGSNPESKFKLCISLHQMHGRRSIVQRAKHLLKPLERPLIPALELIEVVTPSEPTLPPGLLMHLCACAGPQRTWLTAWTYDMLDDVVKMKAVADELFMRDQDRAAMFQYSALTNPWASGLLCVARPSRFYTSDASEPLIMLLGLMVDAECTWGFANLTPENFGAAYRFAIAASTMRNVINQFEGCNRMYNDGREDQPLGWDHYHGVRHLRNLVSLERICRREPEADIDLIGIIREFKLLVKHNPDDE